MRRRPFTKFLLSARTIEVHLLCVTLIVVLSISLWNGDAKPDYVWGLLFTIIAYPTVLCLLWWSDRIDEKAAVEQAIESVSAPEKVRRKRRGWRRGSLVFLATVAAGLVIFGNRGLRVDSIPAQYIGYCFFAIAALGAAGVNIWYGGPLDPRMDPPSETGATDPDAVSQGDVLGE